MFGHADIGRLHADSIIIHSNDGIIPLSLLLAVFERITVSALLKDRTADGTSYANHNRFCGDFLVNLNSKRANAPSAPSENAIARQAMNAIQQIDREARERKLAQAETLNAAKATLHKRIEELEHQLAQIDQVMAAITGSPVVHEKRARRDLSADRERVARWMEGRKGQKFAAGDLLREFPELEGAQISYLLKPLVQDGKIHTDISEGMKRPKYFVAA